MSLAAKITFGGSCVFAASMVLFVHYKQSYDNAKMKEGIIKDIERQKDKKAQNLKALTTQKEFEKILIRKRDAEVQKE